MDLRKKISPNQKSIAGEFAVLSQLALRGINANFTLGNTKRVDILASNPNSGNLYRIEVKTTTTTSSKSGVWGSAYHWMMNKAHENINDDRLFFVFLHLNITGKDPRFFIVPSKVVGKYCYEEHVYWLEHKNRLSDPRFQDTERRTFRIGLEKDGHYSVSTPKASQYEDSWEQLD